MVEDDFSFLNTSDIAKVLANRVKTERKKKFRTQAEFAKHIGLSYSKVSRFEKSGNIQLKDLLIILKALKLVDELQELFVPQEQIIKW